MGQQDISETFSDRIRLARILCVLALVYIHVPPFEPDFLNPAKLAPFETVWLLVRATIGRASVPLLSILSGMLFWQTLSRPSSSYRKIMSNKAKTLTLPLLAWNLIAAVLNLLAGDLPPVPMVEWLNRLIALRDTPLIIPTYFLRDLFICIAIYPVYRTVLDRWPAITLALFAIASVLGLLDWLLITPAILLFFMLGQALASGALTRTSLPVLPIVLILHLEICLLMLFMPTVLPSLSIPAEFWHCVVEAVRLLQRMSGAALFWLLTGHLARWSGKDKLLELEPYVFFYFCGHALLLNAVWHAFGLVGGVEFGSPVYQLFFFGAPVLVALFLIPGASIGARIAPWAISPLSGGRIVPVTRRKQSITASA
jgi:hypothetical protein